MAAARKLFTERGYDASAPRRSFAPPGSPAAPSTTTSAARRACCEAVYEQIEAESTERVAARRPGSELQSPLDAMKAGVEAFLDECAEPELRQIALHDAPAVLGWDRWREIGAANGLGPDRGEPRGGDRGGGDPRAAGEAARPPADGRPRRGGDAGRPRRGPRASRAEVTARLATGAAPIAASSAVGRARSASVLAVDEPARLLLRVHPHVGQLHRLGRRVRLLRDRRDPQAALRSKPLPLEVSASAARRELVARLHAAPSAPSSEDAELVAADPVGGRPLLADASPSAAAPASRSISSPAGWPKVSL